MSDREEGGLPPGTLAAEIRRIVGSVAPVVSKDLDQLTNLYRRGKQAAGIAALLSLAPTGILWSAQAYSRGAMIAAGISAALAVAAAMFYLLQKKRERLVAARVEVAVHDALAACAADLSRALQETARAASDLRVVTEHLAEQQRRLERCASDLAAAQSQHSSLQEQIALSKIDLSSARVLKRSMDVEIQNLREERSNLGDRVLPELREKKDKLSAEVKQVVHEWEVANRLTVQARAELGDAEERLERIKHEAASQSATVDDLGKKRSEEETRTANARREWMRLVTEKETAQREIESNRQAIEETARHSGDVIGELRRLRFDQERERERAEDAWVRRVEVEAELARLSSRRDMLDADIARLKGALADEAVMLILETDLKAGFVLDIAPELFKRAFRDNPARARRWITEALARHPDPGRLKGVVPEQIEQNLADLTLTAGGDPLQDLFVAIGAARTRGNLSVDEMDKFADIWERYFERTVD
jgi:hypothetical protein